MTVAVAVAVEVAAAVATAMLSEAVTGPAQQMIPGT